MLTRGLYQKSPNCWPTAVKAFSYRYIHENLLYHTQQTDSEDIDGFSRALEEDLGLFWLEEQNQLVLRQCQDWIDTAVKNLKKDGILEERENGHITQTSGFSQAWKVRRDSWLEMESVSHANTLTPSSTGTEPPDGHLTVGQKRKRTYAGTEVGAGSPPKFFGDFAGRKLPKFPVRLICCFLLHFLGYVALRDFHFSTE